MFRVNNYTTILLVLIVIILLVGVGVAAYYVFDLKLFDKEDVKIYEEVKPYVEPVKQTNTSLYDITKRTYDISLDFNELQFVVYKDGTVGITMLENEVYNDLPTYNELLNHEIKVSLKEIVKIYKAEATTTEDIQEFVVAIDKDGNLYKFVESELSKNGKYAFSKIEGLANIVDIKQITNTGLTENVNGINAIAIDKENNELLLTNYLLR